MNTQSNAPDRHRAAGPGAALLDWLVVQALPTWSRLGVDRRQGGYFEAIDLQGRPVEAPRRTRVVARQIYVFATAARHGWLPEADANVEHGLRFLFDRLRAADGSFLGAVDPSGAVVDPAFDLYEQAFVLFALASALRERPDRAYLRAEAEALLGVLRTRWSHPTHGFEEATPRRLPLRSNPHMHLLEAALAWRNISAGSDAATWVDLADELAALCLQRLIDPTSGALREHFDGEWLPMPGTAGRVVEPGHQFEWAWLLMRWAGPPTRHDAPDRSATRAAAGRLIDIGETHGVDPGRNVAVNTLDDSLSVDDAAAKLWPQTERVKAWHQALLEAPDAATAKHAGERLVAGIEGMTRYLLPSPPGLWREVMHADGSFATQDCRASSLYHVVCAIETLAGEPAPLAGERA